MFFHTPCSLFYLNSLRCQKRGSSVKRDPLFFQAERKSVSEHTVLSAHDFDHGTVKGQTAVVVSVSNWSFVRDNQDVKAPLSCSTSDLMVSLKLASEYFRNPANQEEFAFDKQSASIPFNSFLALASDVIKRLCPDVKASRKSYKQNMQMKRDLADGISAQRMSSSPEIDPDSDDSDTNAKAKKLKSV